MKTIIIPTDFSNNSLKAMDFAVDFFNQEGNKFVLINVYDIPRGGTSGLFTLLEQLREQAEKDMVELEELLNVKYINEKFTIATKVLQGNFEEQVKNYAGANDADFVVIGTKGASGVKELLIGSNASKLLKVIKTPVFAIPTDYHKEQIAGITFSYDGNNMEADKVALMKTLSVENELPLKVLHVRKEDESPIQNWQEIESKFDDFHISLHEVYGENYEEGLRSAIEELNSILVLIRRKKSFWEKLINDSDSQRVVRHFKVPILVLPE